MKAGHLRRPFAAHDRWRLEAEAARLEARTDYLTGIGNARALGEALAAIEAAPDAAGTCVCVLFVDIDHFGDYNRHHGEDAGDDALRRVSGVVAAAVAPRALAYRKGGEEFVVPILGCDRQCAGTMAERIRADVQRLGVPHGASSTAAVLTVTVGMATAGGGAVRATLNDAARAAFDGKLSGHRNRVHRLRSRADQGVGASR